MSESGHLHSVPTGVILTGGHSIRFGEDKANAQWRGKRLIDHVAERLRTLCHPLIAVARRGQSTQGWPVDRIVYDEPELPPGPLRGIVTGLAAVEAAHAIIVSCDSPLMQPALLCALNERSGSDNAALIPRWDNRLQPLVGLYAKASEPSLRRSLLEGEQSPTRALIALGAEILEEETCREYDPHGLSFISCNSSDALAALENALQHDEFGGMGR